MFADYFLQTQRMLSDRAEYVHVGRVQHVIIHAIGSAIAFALLLTNPVFILVTVVIEAVVHYHIDWAKDNLNQKWDLTPDQSGYWSLTGLDQLLHQLTYIAMVWAWAAFTL